jgi:hypothetical protein
MTFPTVTQLAPALARITGISLLGFVASDLVSGSGAQGVLAAILVTLIVHGFKALAQIRQQKIENTRLRTDGTIAIDQERDKLADRAEKVHQQEIESLNKQHTREIAFLRESAGKEKRFLQNQVNYHERLELVTRKRLHAMV